MPKIGDINIGSGDGNLSAKPNDSQQGTSTATSGSTINQTSTMTVTGDNLGVGQGVFAGANGTTDIVLEFKSLVAGAGIDISSDGQNLTITSTGTITPNLEDLIGTLQVGHGGTGQVSFSSNGILIGNGSSALQQIVAPTGSNKILSWDGSYFVWANMPTFEPGVTSVSMNPGSSKVSVTGGPITSTGTFTVDVNESALALNNIGGTLGVAKGGTGSNSLTANALLLGNGTGAIQTLSIPVTTGSTLTWTGTGYSWSVPASGVTSVAAVGQNGISVSGSPIETTGTLTIGLTATGVAAGSYSYPTVTVDAQGRITSISSNTVATVDGANLGSGGAGLFANRSGSVLNFKQLAAGPGINVAADSTTVTVGVTNLGYTQGGTGSQSYTTGGVVFAGTTGFQSTSAPTAAGQALQWDGSAFAWVPTVSGISVTGDSVVTVTPTVNGSNYSYALAFDGSSYNINNFANALGVAKGGTGVTSLGAKQIVLGNGTGPLQTVATPGTSNVFLMWDGNDVVWTSNAAITSITAGQGLSITPDDAVGGGTITATGTLNLTDTGVTAGSYQLLGATVDAKGRLTSATDKMAFVLNRANHTGTMPLSALGTTSPGVYDFGVNTIFAQTLSTDHLRLDGTASQFFDVTVDGVSANITGGTISFVADNYSFTTTSTNTGWEIDALGNLSPVGSVTIGTSGSRVSNIYADDINVTSLKPVAKTALLSDTTGTLPYTRGGTGLTTLGTANQVLMVNTAGDAIVWGTPVSSGGDFYADGHIQMTGGLKLQTDLSGVPTGTVTAPQINFGKDSSDNAFGFFSDAQSKISVVLDNSQPLLHFTTQGLEGDVNGTQGGIFPAGYFGWVFDKFTGLRNPGSSLAQGTFQMTSNNTVVAEVNSNGLKVVTGGLKFPDNTVQTTAANPYTLFPATTSVLGGVIVGSGLNIDGSGVLSSNATGTVTSVDVTAGSNKVSVSGTTITSSGSFTIDVNEYNISIQNLSGTLPVTKGGTGLTTFGTAGQVLATNATADGLEWITAPTGGSTAPNYEEFVATAGQTVFNTTMTTTAKGAGKAYLQVFVNGVFQMEGASKSFTVTGSNQITFNAGLALNDDVAIYGF